MQASPTYRFGPMMLRFYAAEACLCGQILWELACKRWPAICQRQYCQRAGSNTDSFCSSRPYRTGLIGRYRFPPHLMVSLLG